MNERWSGRLLTTEPTGRAQIESALRDSLRGVRVGVRLPEHVLRLAQAEYEHQHGRQQDYERMQERGGLGVLEVIGLLADLAERLGAKPTAPRPLSDSHRTDPGRNEAEK